MTLCLFYFLIDLRSWDSFIIKLIETGCIRRFKRMFFNGFGMRTFIKAPLHTFIMISVQFIVIHSTLKQQLHFTDIIDFTLNPGQLADSAYTHSIFFFVVKCKRIVNKNISFAYDWLIEIDRCLVKCTYWLYCFHCFDEDFLVTFGLLFILDYAPTHCYYWEFFAF